MKLNFKNISFATVNDILLEKYVSIEELNLSIYDYEKILFSIIEENLLYRNIEKEEDIKEILELVKNNLFSSVGEWLDDYMRKKIANKLYLCSNCLYIDNEFYCPIIDSFVNPHFKGCDNCSIKN